MTEQTYENTEYPIVIENISKTYRIAHRDTELIRPEHESIKDAIVRAAKKPLKLADSHYGRSRETFYALDNVNLKIKKGQVMAVMGKNGSGKSTLFKIIARVTSPTSGRATITGRVGSLLEVGAGFHNELTGRENVYFNGSILGMKKSEIKKNFDSILKFAEMDRFIDTPVKFYSSGMRTRLAFSIAIHLDTDILLMDEVLAVGDYAFKMKCFETMEKIAKQGKTILFVSHLPGQVRRICTDGVLMKEGKIIFKGTAEEVISEYLESREEDDEDGLSENPQSSQHGKDIKIGKTDVKVDQKKESQNVYIQTALKNQSDKNIKNIRMHIFIKNKDGVNLASFVNDLANTNLTLEKNQEKRFSLKISGMTLEKGDYSTVVRITDKKNPSIVYDNKKVASAIIIKSTPDSGFKLLGFHLKEV